MRTIFKMKPRFFHNALTSIVFLFIALVIILTIYGWVNSTCPEDKVPHFVNMKQVCLDPSQILIIQ